MIKGAILARAVRVRERCQDGQGDVEESTPAAGNRDKSHDGRTAGMSEAGKEAHVTGAFNGRRATGPRL